MKIVFRGTLHPYLRDRLEPLISRPEFKIAWERMLRRHYHYATKTVALTSYTDANAFLEAFIVSLHAQRAFSGTGRGATISELASLVIDSGIFSARTGSQLIQRLEDEGKIERMSLREDQRVRRIVPTPKLIKEKKELYRSFIEPLPILGMGHNKTEACIEDELHFLRVVHECVGLFLEGVDMIRPFPHVQFLESKLRGPLCSAVMLIANADTFGEITADRPFPLTITKTAEGLSVSRAHVRNLMNALQERGLISYDDSTCTMTAAFVKELARAAGSTFLFFDMAIARTLGYAATTGYQLMAGGAGAIEKPHERS